MRATRKMHQEKEEDEKQLLKRFILHLPKFAESVATLVKEDAERKVREQKEEAERKEKERKKNEKMEKERTKIEIQMREEAERLDREERKKVERRLRVEERLKEEARGEDFRIELIEEKRREESSNKWRKKALVAAVVGGSMNGASSSLAVNDENNEEATWLTAVPVSASCVVSSRGNDNAKSVGSADKNASKASIKEPSGPSVLLFDDSSSSGNLKSSENFAAENAAIKSRRRGCIRFEEGIEIFTKKEARDLERAQRLVALGLDVSPKDLALTSLKLAKGSMKDLTSKAKDLSTAAKDLSIDDLTTAAKGSMKDLSAAVQNLKGDLKAASPVKEVKDLVSTTIQKAATIQKVAKIDIKKSQDLRSDTRKADLRSDHVLKRAMEALDIDTSLEKCRKALGNKLEELGDDLGERIDDFGEKLGDLKEDLGEKIGDSRRKSFGEKLWLDHVGEKLDQLGETLGLDHVGEKLDQLGETLGLDQIKENLGDKLEDFGETLKKQSESFGDKLDDLQENLKNGASSFSEHIVRASDCITDKLEDVAEAVIDAGETIGDNIKHVIDIIMGKGNEQMEFVTVILPTLPDCIGKSLHLTERGTLWLQKFCHRYEKYKANEARKKRRLEEEIEKNKPRWQKRLEKRKKDRERRKELKRLEEQRRMKALRMSVVFVARGKKSVEESAKLKKKEEEEQAKSMSLDAKLRLARDQSLDAKLRLARDQNKLAAKLAAVNDFKTASQSSHSAKDFKTASSGSAKDFKTAFSSSSNALKKDPPKMEAIPPKQESMLSTIFSATSSDMIESCDGSPDSSAREVSSPIKKRPDFSKAELKEESSPMAIHMKPSQVGSSPIPSPLRPPGPGPSATPSPLRALSTSPLRPPLASTTVLKESSLDPSQTLQRTSSFLRFGPKIRLRRTPTPSGMRASPSGLPSGNLRASTSISSSKSTVTTSNYNSPGFAGTLSSSLSSLSKRFSLSSDSPRSSDSARKSSDSPRKSSDGQAKSGIMSMMPADTRISIRNRGCPDPNLTEPSHPDFIRSDTSRLASVKLTV